MLPIGIESVPTYGSPDGRQNRHLRLSSDFWRLFSHADRQIGAECGRSVASR